MMSHSLKFIFHLLTSHHDKRRGSAEGCAFSGLENKNVTFKPRNSRKTAILGPVLTGLRKFSTENRIHIMAMCSRVISPSVLFLQF